MKNCQRIPSTLPFANLEATDYISDDMLRQGAPNEMGKSHYSDSTGQLDVGVWQCDVNRHEMNDCPYDEFVYLLEGHLDIIDEQGLVETYQAGDSFVMPRGANCTWDVKKPIRKIYVVLEPKLMP